MASATTPQRGDPASTPPTQPFDARPTNRRVLSLRVVAGSKTLTALVKPLRSDLMLRGAVDVALTRARESHIIQGEPSVSLFHDQNESGAGQNFDLEDLDSLTLEEVAPFGNHVRIMVAVDEGATREVNATERLMSDASKRCLPPPYETNRYDFNIFNSLLKACAEGCCKFSLLDAEPKGTGTSFLFKLAQTLQYILPFDDAEPSPLRLAGRVSLAIPARFKTEVLGSLCPRVLPASCLTHAPPVTQALKVKTSEAHHGAKPTEARLRSDILQLHSERVAHYINGPGWSRSSAWAPFMQDVADLVASMQKLAEAMRKSNQHIKLVRSSMDPPRAPSDEDYVDLIECPPMSGARHPRYDALSILLDSTEPYTETLLDDTLMGIKLASSRDVKRHSRDQYKRQLQLTDKHVVLHYFNPGGPHSLVVHVWWEPEDNDTHNARRAAAIARCVKAAPQHATRAMQRELFNEYAPVGVDKAVLRSLWTRLSPGLELERKPEQVELDDRLMAWMLESGESPELFYDLRALNERSGGAIDCQCVARACSPVLLLETRPPARYLVANPITRRSSALCFPYRHRQV